MILDLCECILNGLNTPNINQILHNIQKADVCTATQCFETNEDAGFGSIPENPDSNSWLLILSLGFCATVVIRNVTLYLVKDFSK